MASKIIPSFVGPITPSAVDEWLSQCEDGFVIYASMKSEKSPALDVVTKICLTGTQLQEPTAAAWWNAGRKEFLKLATWELFEKQICTRFMAKRYRLLALCTFFLLHAGKASFLGICCSVNGSLEFDRFDSHHFHYLQVPATFSLL
jgi:hypothetical protein